MHRFGALCPLQSCKQVCKLWGARGSPHTSPMTWQVAARVAVSHFSLFATPTSPVVRRFFNGIFFNGEMDNSSDATNPEDIGGNTVAARGRWVHTHATIRFALILKQTHAAGSRTHGKKRSRSIVHRSLPRESTNHTFLYPPVGSRSRMSHRHGNTCYLLPRPGDDHYSDFHANHFLVSFPFFSHQYRHPQVP